MASLREPCERTRHFIENDVHILSTSKLITVFTCMEKYKEMEATESAVLAWIKLHFFTYLMVKPRKKPSCFAGIVRNCPAKDMLSIVDWWTTS